MNFFDTCSLLDLQQTAFKSKFLISNYTIIELEQIKTSGTKDEDTKWAARKVLHLLAQNEDMYTVVFGKKTDKIIKKFSLPQDNDSRIVATAYEYYKKYGESGLTFVTSDLACREIAKMMSLPTELTLSKDVEDDYLGYREVIMDEEDLAIFYEKILINRENRFDLKINEYLLIADKTNKIVDKYKWTAEGYVKVSFHAAESMMFGKITPVKGDIYQQCALDSLYSNQVTVMRGKPGSGKSYLALGYLMSQLEKGKIDKIIIFVNCVAVRGAAKLGFYPGDKNSKMLDSQIGNFLISKFGDITEVEHMIDEGTLVLVPVADCRGMDTSGMKAGILVTEAQNLSRDMVKLLLQRIGEDSIAVFEGDDKAQVDMREYAGSNNGLRAMSEAFRGESLYGEVTLQIIHRSKIAELAERI